MTLGQGASSPTSLPAVLSPSPTDSPRPALGAPACVPCCRSCAEEPVRTLRRVEALWPCCQHPACDRNLDLGGGGEDRGCGYTRLRGAPPGPQASLPNAAWLGPWVQSPCLYILSPQPGCKGLIQGVALCRSPSLTWALCRLLRLWLGPPSELGPRQTREQAGLGDCGQVVGGVGH